MAVQAARGMAFLHAQNPAVIHFDLKPDNLLVDGDGETLHVKVSVGLWGNSLCGMCLMGSWEMKGRIVSAFALDVSHSLFCPTRWLTLGCPNTSYRSLCCASLNSNRCVCLSHQVADFGLSKHKFQTFVSCRDLRGTLPYMAPELVSNPNQVRRRDKANPRVRCRARGKGEGLGCSKGRPRHQRLAGNAYLSFGAASASCSRCITFRVVTCHALSQALCRSVKALFSLALSHFTCHLCPSLACLWERCDVWFNGGVMWEMYTLQASPPPVKFLCPHCSHSSPPPSPTRFRSAATCGPWAL